MKNKIYCIFLRLVLCVSFITNEFKKNNNNSNSLKKTTEKKLPTLGPLRN